MAIKSFVTLLYFIDIIKVIFIEIISNFQRDLNFNANAIINNPAIRRWNYVFRSLGRILADGEYNKFY